MKRDGDSLEKLMALRSKPFKTFVDDDSLQIQVADHPRDGISRFKNFYRFYQREEDRSTLSNPSLSSVQLTADLKRAESIYQTMMQLRCKIEASYQSISKMC